MTAQLNSNMAFDRLLFLIVLVPHAQVKQIYAIPLVPWLVAFSISFIIIRSRPQKAIYAISLIVLLSLHISTQTVIQTRKVAKFWRIRGRNVQTVNGCCLRL